MPEVTAAHRRMAGDLLGRAERRLQGATVAASRTTADQGEFDNNFDGVVSSIFHMVDAYELATSGIKRQMSDADQPTRIQAVLASLRAANVPDLPPASRLMDLNRRRNTSVHGEWLEVLDRDLLEDAIRSARTLLIAIRRGLAARGIDLS